MTIRTIDHGRVTTMRGFVAWDCWDGGMVAAVDLQLIGAHLPGAVAHHYQVVPVDWVGIEAVDNIHADALTGR